MDIQFPNALENLIHHFAQLPGIGRKTAVRLAMHMAKLDKPEALQFAKAIELAKEQLHFCSRCFNIAEGDLCQVCRDVKRDETTICVVEDFTDIISIEKSGEFQGLYHVLNGLLSPLEGRTPQDLTIQELVQRVHPPVQEVIFALDSGSEGEVTMFYITRLLKEKSIKITHLARGVPMGTHLEYLDAATLGKAFAGRQEVQ